MKVRSVTCAPPPLIPWIPAIGDQIRAQFGDALQEPECDRWWIFTEDWLCSIATDCGVLVMSAKRGAGIDLASIPGLLEALEKRDDRTGFIGAVVHDILFAIQVFSFETANSIFTQINRLHGMGRFQAWRRDWAVNSSAGRKAWDACSMQGDIDYELRWFNVRHYDR